MQTVELQTHVCTLYDDKAADAL